MYFLQVLTISSGGAAAAAASKPKKGAAAKGSSSAAAVSITLRSDDIADHALQVSRMLPGGLSVLGLYLFAPDSGFSSATSALCKTLCSIAADLAALTNTSSKAKSTNSSSNNQTAAQEQQELLLLHVDSASRKFTMKSCLASSGEHAAAGSLKPCEFKFGPSLASLVCLRARHTFNLTMPATDSAAQLQQLLQEAVMQESARVMDAVVVVGGSIPASSTQPLADLLPAGKLQPLRTQSCNSSLQGDAKASWALVAAETPLLLGRIFPCAHTPARSPVVLLTGPKEYCTALAACSCASVTSVT